jgi:glycosyltransferase involved in cell wall biosynthesis
VRIYIKEVTSLRENGFDVSLIVSDGKGDDLNNKIYDVGKSSNRFERLFSIHKKIFIKAMKLDCDIYHFHDPELVVVGNKLLKKGKKVIYDVHEDLPRQLLSKPYLKMFFPGIISKIVEFWENKYSRRFNLIVTATPTINERFLKVNKNSISIMNFPRLDEIDFNESKDFTQKNKVLYIGQLTEVRGIFELVNACEHLDNEFIIGGAFAEKEFEEKIKNLPGWQKVKYLGIANRENVKEQLFNSHIGIAVLYPIENYLTSYPVKMFEYMAAGLPVIASDFKLWKDIVENNNCGICVRPKSIDDMKNAIQYLSDNPQKSLQMGKNGRKLVLEKYNWDLEANKLISVYRQISDEF